MLDFKLHEIIILMKVSLEIEKNEAIFFKKMSSNIARGDILRASIINHSLALLRRALLEHKY